MTLATLIKDDSGFDPFHTPAWEVKQLLIDIGVSDVKYYDGAVYIYLKDGRGLEFTADKRIDVDIFLKD